MDTQMQGVIPSYSSQNAPQATFSSNQALPLWGHQVQALANLERMPAILLDMAMGTGKSRVIIEHINTQRPGRTLIICPKAVRPVWKEQISRYATRPVELIELPAKSVCEQAAWLKHALCRVTSLPQVVLLHYDIVWRDPLGGMILSYTWDMVVADESHRIKAAGSKVSRYFARLSQKGKKRVALTGTPCPNNPLDIYGQYRFLEPRLFGTSIARMREQYCIMGGYQGYQILGYKNQDEMALRVNRIRYHAAQSVLDLPSVVSSTLPVELPPTAQRLYTQLATEFYAQVDKGEVTVTNALVKILRLQQVTSGFLRTDEGEIESIHTAKEEALTTWLEDLPPVEPVVIFVRFTADLVAIQRVCQTLRRSYCELSGRVNELEQWQRSNDPILLVQIQSGSEGIDLTKARYAVFFSFTHSGGLWRQAHARLHRPGQSQTVHNLYVVAEQTIDGQILEALERKVDVVQAILDKGR